MVGRTEPASREEKHRMDLIVRATGCLPCLLGGFPNGHATVQHVVEGRKRLGHRYTYGACRWHHLGNGWIPGMGVLAMTHAYGPSLAHNPREYHDEFGSERELVALQDRALEVYAAEPWPDHDMPDRIAFRLRQFHLAQRGSVSECP